jgi:hypothetical protein
MARIYVESKNIGFRARKGKEVSKYVIILFYRKANCFHNVTVDKSNVV